jgi:hypothetical protein
MTSLVFGLPPDIVEATLDSLGIVQIATLESKVHHPALFLVAILTVSHRSQITWPKELRSAVSDVVFQTLTRTQHNASLDSPLMLFLLASVAHLQNLRLRLPLYHLLVCPLGRLVVARTSVPMPLQILAIAI